MAGPRPGRRLAGAAAPASRAADCRPRTEGENCHTGDQGPETQDQRPETQEQRLGTRDRDSGPETGGLRAGISTGNKELENGYQKQETVDHRGGTGTNRSDTWEQRSGTIKRIPETRDQRPDNRFRMPGIKDCLPWRPKSRHP